MPGRNHSRQFKLECVRQLATGQKRPSQDTGWKLTWLLVRDHGFTPNVIYSRLYKGCGGKY
jgi:hypothetical protein